MRKRYETQQQTLERLTYGFVGEINMYGLNETSWARMVGQLKQLPEGLKLCEQAVEIIRSWKDCPEYIHPGAKELAVAMFSVLIDDEKAVDCLWDSRLNAMRGFSYVWDWTFKEYCLNEKIRAYFLDVCTKNEGIKEAVYAFVDVEMLAVLMQSMEPENPSASSVLVKNSQKRSELWSVFRNRAPNNKTCRTLGVKLCQRLAMDFLERPSRNEDDDACAQSLLIASGAPDEEDFEAYCAILQRHGWWKDWIEGVLLEPSYAYWKNVFLLQDVSIAEFLTKALQHPVYGKAVHKAVEVVLKIANENPSIEAWHYYGCVAFIKSIAKKSALFDAVLVQVNKRYPRSRLKKAMQGKHQREEWDAAQYRRAQWDRLD